MTKNNRVAAIVGAYGSGKTSLLESILYTTGAILSKGGEFELTRFSDNHHSFEHSLRKSVTINSTVAHTSFLGDNWTFIDCPGYQEFVQETYNALMVSDIAIVVCEPDPEKCGYIHHVMRFLEEHKIPRLIFINKIDTLKVSIKDVLNALQYNSEAMLALREIPIQDNDGEVKGFVDLIQDRAYKYGNAEYKNNKSLHLDNVPNFVSNNKEDAKQELVEALAEYNDTLLEMLLEDKNPTKDKVYDALSFAMNKGEIVPVFFGIAENDEGIFRLLKALRHDVTGVDNIYSRYEVTSKNSCFKVFKNIFDNDKGVISYARVLKDGLREIKKLGLFYSVNGCLTCKVDEVEKGDIIAIVSKLGLKVGAGYDENGDITNESFIAPLPVMQSIMFSGYNISDEPLLLKALENIKLSDISSKFDYIKESDKYFLWGQGREHLSCLVSLIKKMSGLDLEVLPAVFPMKKTLSKVVKAKMEHNQKNAFGHVEVAEFDYEIYPLSDTEEVKISIEADLPKGVKKALNDGLFEIILNHAIVGIEVRIVSAEYNETDSNEEIFKIAARKAMSGVIEKFTKNLEASFGLKITVLNDSLGALQKLIFDYEGKILDLVEKKDCRDFQEVFAKLPKSKLYDFSNQLKTISYGMGYYKIIS